MSITSLYFMAFLCCVAVIAYLVPARFRYVWLLLCSYGFVLYTPAGFTAHIPAFLFLLCATATSYLAAVAMESTKNKIAKNILLAVSLTVCLGILLVCKYFNFFVSNVETAVHFMGIKLSLPRFSLLLPLGISYYTLQIVSYSIDVYKEKITAEKNPAVYALYVAFFPGMVTGPINRAEKMLPQYKNPAKINYDRISGGLFRILWGIIKKMVIADSIGLYTSYVFKNTASLAGPHLFLATIAFAYQLYMDFSGCCDIAIGAARILGFDFSENFNRPFSATSFQELWRRWHMTLTSFLKDYVYIPLGGNRVSPVRWAFNTILVFTISGLWHGASAGYLFWGLLNGLILVVAKLIHNQKEKVAQRIPIYPKKLVRSFFQRMFTYLLFAGCLGFFACSLFGTPALTWAANLAKNWVQLFSTDFIGVFTRNGLTILNISGIVVSCCIVEGIEHFAVKPGSSVSLWIRKRGWFVRWPLYYILFALLLVFGAFGKSPFIYQQY